MEKNGSNMKDLRNKRWRQSNTNREAFERQRAGHVRGGFHVSWGRSWWEKQSRLLWAAVQTVFTVETASRHSRLSLSQQRFSSLIIAVFLFEDDLSGFVAVRRNFCFVQMGPPGVYYPLPLGRVWHISSFVCVGLFWRCWKRTSLIFTTRYQSFSEIESILGLKTTMIRVHYCFFCHNIIRVLFYGGVTMNL